MKIAPIVIGAVYGQSGDYSDYVAPAASAGEDRWDSWGADTSFNVGYGSGGKAYTSSGSPAAVTCWQSNKMGNLNHYTTYTDTHGWNNDHHGHDQAANQGHISTDDTDAQVGTWYVQHGNNTPDMDIHSIAAFDNRYSGCIYEKSSWNYSSTTYKYKVKVHYGRANDGTKNSSGLDAINTFGSDGPIRVNWWHYFNAHVFAGGANNEHYITMANPQYEGLGYLNFIVTFAKSTDSTFNGDGYGSRDKNFNTLPEGILTDLYSPGDAFEFFQGAAEAEEWYSTYTSGGANSGSWVDNAALSSFPHNDLGKDFRFNVRVLTKLGDGGQTDKDSYYFYKINKIGINFPYVVRCPKETKNIQTVDGAGDTFRCMDAANHNGHRSWSNQVSNPATGTQTNDEKYNTPTYTEDLTGGSPGADFCTTARADGEFYQCGNTYSVEGLMNTYDEAAQKEFGTYQEFWFQFFYNFEIDLGAVGKNKIQDTGNAGVNTYNYPNILFNAFEVTDVTFVCNNTGRKNGNTC